MKRVWSYGNSNYLQDPQERPEPEYLSDTEEIEFNLDTVITIDEDGTWDYEDKDYTWARSNEENDEYWWTESELYPAMPFVSYDEIVEYTDDLLDSLLPFKAGRYRISGIVKLVFFVDGVEYYKEYIGEGPEDEVGGVYEDEYVSDRADVDFQYNESSIEDFEIEEI